MDTNIPKTPDAIGAAVSDAQNELRRLRFSASANQLKQVRQIRALRLRIAQLKTALRAA